MCEMKKGRKEPQSFELKTVLAAYGFMTRMEINLEAMLITKT